MRKAYVKLREEGPGGTGVLKEDQLVEAKLPEIVLCVKFAAADPFMDA